MGDATTVELTHFHRHVQVDLEMIIDDVVSSRNLFLGFLLTYTSKKQ